ncbi:MAG: radical SAM protein [Ignavibacteria bacterium]|nr:radical SAM protein [Ignavibacteria bacterium]
MTSINELYKRLESCDICPHNCNVNRMVGEIGKCGTNSSIIVSSYGPHFGEEPELVGYLGSGTIFFSGCNLLCVFCQNYTISHCREGRSVSINELANIMLRLQDIGCHNINLVSPTHYAPQIAQSIIEAKSYGLAIPIVYNTGCYDKVETLKALEGLIDIYMPDLKFSDPNKAKLYTEAPDYFYYASSAVIEMKRQVGILVVRNGIARRGLIIRHLILPDNQSDTIEIIDFIAENLGTDIYLNLMDQYYPRYQAYQYPKLSRSITTEEYSYYIDYAKSRGFRNPKYIFGYG